MTKTIKIKGKKYKIKPSFRAMFLYEEMAKKSIQEMDSMEDTVKFLYCILKANNKETFTYGYEEFLDVLEDNPKLLSSLNGFGELGN